MTVERAIADYAAGEPLELIRTYRAPGGSFYAALRRSGIPMRGYTHPRRVQHDDVRRLHAEGLHDEAIGAQLFATRLAIRRVRQLLDLPALFGPGGRRVGP